MKVRFVSWAFLCFGLSLQLANLTHSWVCLFTIYTERFRKIRLGSKWNTNYWVVPVSYFRSESTGTSERVFLFFRTEFSKRKFVFHFQALAAVIWKRNCMISTNDKRDSGAKFTSPEFYPQKQRDLSRKTLNGFLYTYLSLTIFLCVLFENVG